MDEDGYGRRPEQDDLDRLLEDSRTLSPAGVERVAAGWDARGDTNAFHEAEQAALSALEQARTAPRWDALRNQLLGLTERGNALVAWQYEHGEVRHKAENALLAAALALLAGEQLDRRHNDLLRRPMGEALPWLLINPAQQAG